MNNELSRWVVVPLCGYKTLCIVARVADDGTMVSLMGGNGLFSASREDAEYVRDQLNKVKEAA